MKKILMMVMALSVFGYMVAGCAPAEESATDAKPASEKKEGE